MDVKVIAKYLTGVIIRWLLKFAGGFLAAIGIGEGDVEKIIYAFVLFGVGVALSFIQDLFAKIFSGKSDG